MSWGAWNKLTVMGGILTILAGSGAISGKPEGDPSPQVEKEKPRLMFRIPVSGDWELTLEGTDTPPSPVELHLEQNGEKVSGHLVVEQRRVPLLDGSFNQGKITLTFEHPEGKRFQLTGLWKPKMMLGGDWKQGELAGEWEAKRVSE